MLTLPEILKAEELRTLDIAGLVEQLGWAQQAIEIIQDAKKSLLNDLIDAQNKLLDAQKVVHKIKIELKDLTNNTNKFLERSKVIKTLIRGEK